MTDLNDQDAFEEDPQLRALLGQADPARSLAPADPDGLAGLLLEIQEDSMSTDLETRPETAAGRRGPLTWVAAAAAVAVIGGGGAFAAMSLGGDDPLPQAAPAGEPVVVTLDAPTPVAAKCAVVTPELLAGAEIAFAGTVTSVEGDVVTLTPTETYAGQTADEIEVVGLSQDLRPALEGMLDFQVGSTYLVSATGGQVSACGFSGPVSPQLEQIYDAAFR